VEYNKVCCADYYTQRVSKHKVQLHKWITNQYMQLNRVMMIQKDDAEEDVQEQGLSCRGLSMMTRLVAT